MFAGRMHAAPTSRGKRATNHKPHKGQTPTAGSRPRPTEQNKRQMTRKQVIVVFYHTENLIFCAALGRTPHPFFIFIF